MLSNFTNYKIKEAINNEIKFNILNIPCHTQAVERIIKLVTEASFA